MYGQKNRVISDEICFSKNTVVRRYFKKNISYRRIKTQKHSVSIELPYSGSFYEHFYIQLTYAVFLYSKP